MLQNKVIDKLNKSFSQYLSLSIRLLSLNIFLRFFETLIIVHYQGLGFPIYFLRNIEGFLYDIIYFAKASIILYLIFFAIYCLSDKMAIIIYKILFAIMLIASTCLVNAFAINEMPMDRVIFMYPLKEVIKTIKVSTPVVWWGYLAVIVFPILFILPNRKNIHLRNYTKYAFLIIMVLSLFFKDIHQQHYKVNKEYYTVKNKIIFLYESIIDGWKSDGKISSDNYYKTAISFQSYFPDLEFVNSRCPFLYKDNSDTEDVLSSYFNLSDTKPNFVFMSIEGLGREFSGYNSKYPSATPFLDSLSATGLSWINCMSTSQRTICVLPSVFGALPFGKSGFMTYKNDVPEFNSLLKILHDNNGYTSSFFYGGRLCFDNMCNFLQLNHIDNYLDEHKYDNNKRKNEWGLYDDYLFNEAINNIDFSSPKPRVDIFMTLTTHDPFTKYPNAKKYIAQYKKMYLESKCTHVLHENSFKKYASYLYLDNSLRKLIEAYKSKPGFENTIFIFTGDHNFNMSTDSYEIFHVPLIIWSPMLNKAKQFKAMASHRDITPTILAMLKKKYKINIPTNVAWINTGLDTSSYFRCNTFSPLLNLGRNLDNMMYKDYFVEKNRIYKFYYKNDLLSIEPADNDKKQKQSIMTLFNAYRTLDMYVMNNNALITDKLISKKYLTKTYINISDDEQMINYFKHEGLTIGDYKGYKSVAYCHNSEFPFELFSYFVNENDQTIKIQYSFDLFVDSTYNYKEETPLHIVYTIHSPDGQELFWNADNIKPELDETFGKWKNFNCNQLFLKERYSYKAGDKISVYIWDKGQYDFYLKNLRNKVEVYNY